MESTTDTVKDAVTQTPAPQTDGPSPVARSRARTAPTGQGVELSEKAAEKIREIMRAESNPDTKYLFVGVKGGGCSGLQPILDLRDESESPVAETDEIFLSQDIVVVCDLKSFMAGNMAGTVIDYVENFMGSGFTVNNPNAKHTCGCGSSYSV